MNLPFLRRPQGSDYAVHKLILGTQTSDGLGNALLIASVKLPKDEVDVDVSKFEESAQSELAGNRIGITTQICHPGEVNKARYNPSNPFVIATKTVSGDVLLFDYSKHPVRPKVEGQVIPQATLKGHSAEGYALDWSRSGGNILASGAEDNLICIWDTTNSSGDLQPLLTLVGHSKAVEAVAWNYYQQTCLVSVGDDRRISLWDTRAGTSAIAQNSHCHNGDINSVTFSPFTEFLFATCSTDKSVKLWDSRKIDKEIYSLDGCHTGDITNVNWSSFSEHILSSSGNDRRIVVWDLSRIGDELTSEEANDGPPELLFMHSGHTGRVNDFAFNSTDEWTLASVADDNILQIWKIADNVYITDSDDEGPE